MNNQIYGEEITVSIEGLNVLAQAGFTACDKEDPRGLEHGRSK